MKYFIFIGGAARRLPKASDRSKWDRIAQNRQVGTRLTNFSMIQLLVAVTGMSLFGIHLRVCLRLPFFGNHSTAHQNAFLIVIFCIL